LLERKRRDDLNELYEKLSLTLWPSSYAIHDKSFCPSKIAILYQAAVHIGQLRWKIENAQKTVYYFKKKKCEAEALLISITRIVGFSKLQELTSSFNKV
jgi:hypothetical protein